MRAAFGDFLDTLPDSHRGTVMFDVLDVVGRSGFGVGSAGLPAYSILIEGFSQALDNDVVLSMKQGNLATPSRVVARRARRLVLRAPRAPDRHLAARPAGARRPVPGLGHPAGARRSGRVRRQRGLAVRGRRRLGRRVRARRPRGPRDAAGPGDGEDPLRGRLRVRSGTRLGQRRGRRRSEHRRRRRRLRRLDDRVRA